MKIFLLLLIGFCFLFSSTSIPRSEHKHIVYYDECPSKIKILLQKYTKFSDNFIESHNKENARFNVTVKQTKSKFIIIVRDNNSKKEIKEILLLPKKGPINIAYNNVIYTIFNSINQEYNDLLFLNNYLFTSIELKKKINSLDIYKLNSDKISTFDFSENIVNIQELKDIHSIVFSKISNSSGSNLILINTKNGSPLNLKHSKDNYSFTLDYSNKYRKLLIKNLNKNNSISFSELFLGSNIEKILKFKKIKNEIISIQYSKENDEFYYLLLKDNKSNKLIKYKIIENSIMNIPINIGASKDIVVNIPINIENGKTISFETLHDGSIVFINKSLINFKQKLFLFKNNKIFDLNLQNVQSFKAINKNIILVYTTDMEENKIRTKLFLFNLKNSKKLFLPKLSNKNIIDFSIQG